MRAAQAAGTSRRGRKRRLAAGAFLALGVALAAWAFWWEPSALNNENHTLRLPGWPQECDGLRVAVLADLHVGSPFNGVDKLVEIVALTERAQPDLVLLAGDYVISDVPGGTFVPPERIAQDLAALSPPLGVYAVLGNHDHWHGSRWLIEAFEPAGITVLYDQAREIRHGECSFWVVGISDFWMARHDVERALSGVPDDAPAIAFTHNPDVFPEVPARVALTIAGHTHGGQVRIPLIGRPIVPSRYGQRYAIGHVVEDGRSLFVSPGLGTSILPVRFLVPPEVSVLTLRPPA